MVRLWIAQEMLACCTRDLQIRMLVSGVHVVPAVRRSASSLLMMLCVQQLVQLLCVLVMEPVQPVPSLLMGLHVRTQRLFQLLRVLMAEPVQPM